MRLIDADALLKRWCSEVCKAKPRCDEDCMFYDYLTIDSLSPTIEPEPHWIPCSERLPRKEEQDDDLGVLVTLGNGYSGLQYDWYHDDHWYDWDGFVVAWMEMPPVYQEEDNK